MSVDLQHYRFSVDDLLRMVQTGILPEDARVELIEGELVEMSPSGSPHSSLVRMFNRLFNRQLADTVTVSVQDSLILGPRSLVEPDVVVLKHREDFYSRALPGAADALLVIEVSDSSHTHETAMKAPMYARAGIPELWILDVEGRRLELHRRPADGRYTQVEPVPPGGSVRPLAFPDLEIRVTEIFRILPESEQKEKA